MLVVKRALYSIKTIIHMIIHQMHRTTAPIVYHDRLPSTSSRVLFMLDREHLNNDLTQEHFRFLNG